MNGRIRSCLVVWMILAAAPGCDASGDGGAETDVVAEGTADDGGDVEAADDLADHDGAEGGEEEAVACSDGDGDGRGAGCAAGDDCDDADPDVWTACAACADADGDSYFAGCDAYVRRLGPDCDDGQATCTADCADTDGDTTPDCLRATWLVTLGDLPLESAVAVVEVSGGGMIVVGTGVWADLGLGPLWAAKLDGRGAAVWTKALQDETGASFWPEQIVDSGSGHLVVVGSSAAVGGASDVRLLALRPDGGVAWARNYEGPDREHGLAVAKAADGDLLVAGVVIAGTRRQRDAFAMRLGDDGTVRWQKRLGGEDTAEGFAGVFAAPGGDVVAVGNSQSRAVAGDAWTVRFDGSTGTIVSQRAYGRLSGSQSAAEGFLASDGDLVLGGMAAGASTTEDFWVARIDPAGAVRWSRTIPCPGEEFLYGLAEGPGGTIVGVGFAAAGTDAGMWAVGFSGAGELLWQQVMRGAGDSAYDVFRASRDGLVVVGSSASLATAGPADAFVARLSATGRLAGSCTRLGPVELPAEDHAIGGEDVTIPSVDAGLVPRDCTVSMVDVAWPVRTVCPE